MTGIPFLKDFSLEQKEKFLNTSFNKKSLIPRGIGSKASILPIERAPFLKELDQKPNSSLRKDKAYKQIPNKAWRTENAKTAKLKIQENLYLNLKP